MGHQAFIIVGATLLIVAPSSLGLPVSYQFPPEGTNSIKTDTDSLNNSSKVNSSSENTVVIVESGPVKNISLPSSPDFDLTVEINEGSDVLAVRQKRAVFTDPNNIRFTVGNTQLFPLQGSLYPFPRGSNYNYNAPKITNVQSVHSIQRGMQMNGQGNSGVGSTRQTGSVVDSGNVGGTHQNQVAIGGIQNFGKKSTSELISQITADTNNRGGTHSNNVAIGGILNFD